jgi:hypothetical protein
MGDGASIIIHAHFDFNEGPHPLLRNLPYGAEIWNKIKKTAAARLKTAITEKLYAVFII